MTNKNIKKKNKEINTYHANSASTADKVNIAKNKAAQRGPVESINVVTPGYTVKAIYNGSRSKNYLRKECCQFIDEMFCAKSMTVFNYSKNNNTLH